MLKICRDNWAKYSENLKNRLIKEYEKLEDAITYNNLVEFSIEEILNNDDSNTYWESKVDREGDGITRIDNGCYQGTLLFVIPMVTYQPSSYEYLITYIEYGSCSYCDALESVLYDYDSDESDVIQGLLDICKNLIFNIKRPYYEKYNISNDEWSEVE